MLKDIAHHLTKKISSFTEEDSLVFNNKILPISKDNFSLISSIFTTPNSEHKTISFIDGGQAEILSAGNFSVSFIRVAALRMQHKGNEIIKKLEKKEFFLVTTANYLNGDLIYESTIFGDKIIDANDLLLSSNDATIKSGKERASISKITNVARRFAELALAGRQDSDYVLLDGSLETSYTNEEKYAILPKNISALAKTCSLFTTSGNSPAVLLNNLGYRDSWVYTVDEKTSFVKLHPHSKYVFRFDGGLNILPSLLDNSKDAVFLGYPYGLLSVDQLARVSNSERNSLMLKLRLYAKDITSYYNTSNAHAILDSLH